MLYFGFQTVNRSFFLSKHLNMLRGTLLVVFFLLNKLFLPLFFFFSLNFYLYERHLKKQHSCFFFRVVTNVSLFYCLFSGFLNAKYIRYSCLLFDRIQKDNCHLSGSSLACLLFASL